MTITIAIFDETSGLPLVAESCDLFTGETMREAVMAALAANGFTETDIPDGIAINSGKSYITEHDGDRFWTQIMCDWISENEEWGYGETAPKAVANALEASIKALEDSE